MRAMLPSDKPRASLHWARSEGFASFALLHTCRPCLHVQHTIKSRQTVQQGGILCAGLYTIWPVTVGGCSSCRAIRHQQLANTASSPCYLQGLWPEGLLQVQVGVHKPYMGLHTGWVCLQDCVQQQLGPAVLPGC